MSHNFQENNIWRAEAIFSNLTAIVAGVFLALVIVAMAHLAWVEVADLYQKGHYIQGSLGGLATIALGFGIISCVFRAIALMDDPMTREERAAQKQRTKWRDEVWAARRADALRITMTNAHTRYHRDMAFVTKGHTISFRQQWIGDVLANDKYDIDYWK